jgi:TolB protein
MIAFERHDAVWIANLDGTGEKKIADGTFPAISPDGTRVAFNTVEKTGDSKYMRHMAVVDVATGHVTVFKDVPSDNSYYPSWTADGKQILFTTRPKEVWDLVAINADGTNFHVLKAGEQDAVTRYSPVWAHDGQSVFCDDMTNVYQIGMDGAARGQWKVDKIVPNGDMSGDCRIDVSPDGKRLLLSIEMAEESGRKDWDGPLPALWSFDLQSQKATRLTPKKLFGWDGVWIDNSNILFLSRAVGEKEDSIYRVSTDGKDLKRLIKNARFPSVARLRTERCDQQSMRFHHRAVDLSDIRPGALRIFRSATAFAANYRRNLLNQFVCLYFRGQLFRNGRD